MKLGIVSEGLGERLALLAGAVPTPLFYSFLGVLLARAIGVATKLGVFEALVSDPLTAGEVASRCETDARATEKLMNALVRADFLRCRGDRYRLSPTSRKWMLERSPRSLRDATLFLLLEADRIGHLEEFVRRGSAVDFHQSQSDRETWSIYQRGMRSMAGLSASEVARRMPVPQGARDMLDIGGSHGLFSAAICRRHPGLRAVILDLPEAIEYAAPLLAREGMGDRVSHRAGNALSDDLGTEAYDLVLISQLMHHFDEAANRGLVARVARALRPGGVLVLQEMTRGEAPARGDEVGALTDLYFALTSQSGAWSLAEMAAWQRDAGLLPQKPVRLWTLPSAAQQAAIKPRR